MSRSIHVNSVDHGALHQMAQFAPIVKIRKLTPLEIQIATTRIKVEKDSGDEDHFDDDEWDEQNEFGSTSENDEWDEPDKPERKRKKIGPNENGACPICQKIFKYKKSLASHIRRHSKKPVPKIVKKPIERPFKCPFPNCTKSFNWPVLKKRHLEKVHAPDAFICETCATIFPSQIDLNHHKILEHRERVNLCSLCPAKLFPSASKLNAHVQAEHPTEKLFGCKSCPSKFQTRLLLQTHIRFRHQGNMRLACPRKCGKTFKDENDLVDHKKDCTFFKEEYKCEICSKCFINKSRFKEHLWKHNNPERALNCDHPGCTAAFYNKTDFNRHQRRHKDEKPFVCHVCGWGFKETYGLKTHLIVHGEVKRHDCQVCGRSFVGEERFQKHLTFCVPRKTSKPRMEKKKKVWKKKGKGPREYPCTLCHKTFKHDQSRRFHFTTQHELEPSSQFVCHLCGAEFFHGRLLKRHISTKHKTSAPFKNV